MIDQAEVVGWLDVTGGAPEAKIENVPGHQNLRVFQQNELVTLTREQGAAMSFSSVLSLPALLDTVPGQLAAALGG